MEFKEGDIVLCTVDRVVGTVVFVNIDGNREGNIIFSEIAPGRIRNIRDYVVPKKRIACKIIRISNGRIDLSLRRVTQKEKNEVLEQDKQEKSYLSILKSVLKEKAEKIAEEIKKEMSLVNFFEEAKENPKKLDKIAGQEEVKKILEIMGSQKKKKIIVKKEIKLSTVNPEGILLIKKILDKKALDIKYISAGRYLIKIEGEDIKKTDKRIKEAISEIEKDSEANGVEFAVVN